MKKWPWFLLSVVVILLDQASKHWALHTLVPYQPHGIFPMVNFTLAYNTGAAFSFLSGAGDWHRWFFTGFSTLMSVILIVWIFRSPPRSRLLPLALSLVLGGALGNLADRFLHQHVIDFIDLYYAHYHWPAFNLADSAICVGAVLLFIDMLYE
jgi:signal peptidase II